MITDQQAKQQYMTSFHGQTNAMPSNDDQYISQFLVFDPDGKCQKVVSNQEPVQPIPQQNFPDRLDEIYQQSSPLDDSSSVSHKPKRSPLHNFQKHFVTTIRRSLRFRWPQKTTGYLLLAKQMWEIFKNSRKYTKQFVSLILGQSDSHIDTQLLRKYGLLDCVSQYDENQYKKAQAYLKNKVLQTFKTIPKQKIMYERRIEKKEQFASYFFKVLAEIQGGVMNKRLPKKKRGGRRNSYQKFKKLKNEEMKQDNSQYS